MIKYNDLMEVRSIDDLLRLFDLSDMPFGVLSHIRQVVEDDLAAQLADVGEPKTTYDEYCNDAVDALRHDFGNLTARFVLDIAQAKGRKTYLREAVAHYQREFEVVEPDGAVLELLQPLVDKMVSEVEQAFDL